MWKRSFLKVLEKENRWNQILLGMANHPQVKWPHGAHMVISL